MDLEVKADGRLHVPELTLTTDQVDELINHLATARNLMRPEVPAELYCNDELLAGVVYQDEPSVECWLTKDDSVALALRHQGVGWCVFRMPPRHASSIAALLAHTAAQAPDHEGLTGQLGDGDRPQH
ncbi:hypothetical protein [Methylibium petroleiphilum]